MCSRLIRVFNFSAKIKKKMLYSSSFDALKKCLVGVQKYIQVNIIILPAQPAWCLYTNPGHRRVRGFRRGNWAAVEKNWSYMRWSSLISLLLIISILEILFINNFLYHFNISNKHVKWLKSRKSSCCQRQT